MTQFRNWKTKYVNLFTNMSLNFKPNHLIEDGKTVIMIGMNMG